MQVSPGARRSGRPGAAGRRGSQMPEPRMQWSGDSPVNDHPTQAELEGFVWNRVSSDRSRDVLTHLVRGCSQCRTAVTPHFAGLTGLATPPAPKLAPDESAALAAAMGRPSSTVLLKARELQATRERESRPSIEVRREEL